MGHYAKIDSNNIVIQVIVASAGVHKKWNMRREYSSKIDTADFYCMPKIRID